MSERSLRRRIPSTNRREKALQPSPSRRRRTPSSNRRSSKPWRPIQILKRCNSEPTLPTLGLICSYDDHRNLTPTEAVLSRPQTCTDIFSSAESLPFLSAIKFQGYKEEAKVVVNVTVEGSPGPVRTLVKLGANVEETIRLVINKYSEEGRTPPLDMDAASTFELHHSHFALASLNKSDVIGDIGSRSFYLWRGNSGRETMSASSPSEIVLATASSTPSPRSSPVFFLSAFISQTISIILRRRRKLWKILCCLQCS